jgi:4-amino-4-deoxy-L-arabinose transferase-like glycosyltransferase
MTEDSRKPRAGDEPNGPSQVSKGEIVALLLLTILALVVRWGVLTHRELWLDEAYTVVVARAEGWGELLRMVAADNYPPLYFLAMRVWVAVFGFGDAAMRWPSVLAGVALVPLAWALVRETGSSLGRFPDHGSGAPLLAAAVTGLSPVLVHYSLEARPYTLLWALAVGIVIALHRFVRSGVGSRGRGGTGALILAAGLTAVACAVHYFAALLAPVWGLAWWTGRGRRLQVLVAGGAALLPTALWALLAAEWSSGATAWLSGFWSGPLGALWTSVEVFSLGRFPDYLRALGGVVLRPPLAWAVGLWFGVPAAARTVGALREAAGGAGGRALFLPLATFGPAVGLALVSLWHPLYLAGRYELIGYPGWIALWALGVDRAAAFLARKGVDRRSLWVGVTTVTALGLTFLLTVYIWVSPGPWSLHRAAREVVASGDEPVVAVGLIRAPLQVQLWRLGDSREILSFPAEIERHPGWMDLSAVTREDLAREARRLRDRIGTRAVCVAARVGSGGPSEPRLQQILLRVLLSDGSRRVRREEISGITLWHVSSP